MRTSGDPEPLTLTNRISASAPGSHWCPQDPGSAKVPQAGRGERNSKRCPDIAISRSGERAHLQSSKQGWGGEGVEKATGNTAVPAPTPPGETCPFAQNLGYCRVWRASLHSWTHPHSSLLLQVTLPLISSLSKQTPGTHLVGGETEALYPGSHYWQP